MRQGYIVTGRVQGVGFRWWTKQCGRVLKLAGWVRNRSDGSVEVAAEGDSGQLERLEESLAKGPPFSAVQAVEKVDISPDEVLDKPFSIK